ncbi:MAG: hypothetical protein LUC35_01050 [Clostridiales bacterium]|nr:hypothetical protein [Clostridiales bacterium]
MKFTTLPPGGAGCSGAEPANKKDTHYGLPTNKISTFLKFFVEKQLTKLPLEYTIKTDEIKTDDKFRLIVLKIE